VQRDLLLCASASSFRYRPLAAAPAPWLSNGTVGRKKEKKPLSHGSLAFISSRASTSQHARELESHRLLRCLVEKPREGPSMSFFVAHTQKPLRTSASQKDHTTSLLQHNTLISDFVSTLISFTTKQYVRCAGCALPQHRVPSFRYMVHAVMTCVRRAINTSTGYP
jgi:hypothetical protein